MTDNALAIRQAIGVEKLGEIMYKSGYWQDTRSQAQAIVKILAGAELDFGPIASMNGVYIIEGKTSLSANLIGAAIQRSGHYRYRVVEHDEQHCVIDFYEIVGGKREKLGTSSFSMKDAGLAQLLGKRGQMWEKYPRNMVFSRALSNGAKWYTPDVFNGPVYTPDELGAEVDIEGNVIDIPPEALETEAQQPQKGPQEAAQPRQAVPPKRMVTSADDRVWKRWEAIRDDGLRYGADVPALALPIGYEQLVNVGLRVKGATDGRKSQLAREDAARAAARAEREASAQGADTTPEPPQDDSPDPSQPVSPWARNRDLMATAHAAGFKLRELPNSTPLTEVEIRNGEIEQLLEARSQ